MIRTGEYGGYVMARRLVRCILAILFTPWVWLLLLPCLAFIDWLMEEDDVGENIKTAIKG